MTNEPVGRAKGGFARAAKLTAQERSESAAHAGKTRWANPPVISPDMPRVLEGYTSFLAIMDLKLPCAVIKGANGVQRVLSETGITKVMLGSRSGASRSHKASKEDMKNFIPLFVAPPQLSEFITNELREGLLKPIDYVEGTRVVRGYDAEVLVIVCNIWLKARRNGKLHPQQLHKAEQAELLLLALGHMGTVGLIDEATGYQQNRAKDALAKIFSEFLSKERQNWTLTFPLTFYEEIYRLKDWLFEPWNMKRPIIVAKWTDDFIYDRLAPGLTEELRAKNPVAETGRRSHHHHTLFDPDRGHPRLKEHISGVTALLRAADNWDNFLQMIDRVYPKFMNKESTAEVRSLST